MTRPATALLAKRRSPGFRILATLIGLTAVSPPSGGIVSSSPRADPAAGQIRPWAVDDDGRSIVSLDGTDVLVWDARDGRLRHRMRGHEGGIYHVEISRDGTLALTGGIPGNSGTGETSSNRSIRVWNLRTGREVRRLDNLGRDPLGLSPDGRSVLTREKEGSALELWSVATGRRELRLSAADLGLMVRDRIQGADFSRDGRAIIAYLGAGYAVWDRRSGRPLGQNDRTGVGSLVRLSPDGRRVALSTSTGRGRGHAVSVEDVAAGREAYRLDASDGRIVEIAFSRDGRRLVTGADDGAVAVWDAATGKAVRRIAAPGAVKGMAVTDDARRALVPWGGPWTGRDGRPRPDPRPDVGTSLLDLESGRELVRLGEREAPVGFSRDGRTFLALRGRDATVRDSATGRPLRRYRLLSGIDKWDGG